MNKYRAKKVITDSGEKFDSQGEYKRYLDLVLLEKAGKISNLRRQVKYELIPKVDKQREISWIADFVYDMDAKEVIEDFKGFRTEVFKLKKKLFYWRYRVEILET